jgi:hypothetical protein
LLGKLGAGDAGAAPHFVVALAHELVEYAVRIDDRTANAAVADQQIAAEADPHYGCRDIELCEKGAELSCIVRRKKQIRRTADVPRGVLRHGLIAQHARCEIGW